VQSLFIYKFEHFTYEYHTLKTNMSNMLTNEIWTYDWANVIQILHFSINVCVKCVFNRWYKCVKYMNYEWTNGTQFLFISCEMLNLWDTPQGWEGNFAYL
jgi:hypothetical protein